MIEEDLLLADQVDRGFDPSRQDRTIFRANHGRHWYRAEVWSFNAKRVITSASSGPARGEVLESHRAAPAARANR